MALNFPVTPTTGAVYTAEDQSWIWDGQVWLAQSDGMSVEGSDARYLKLTGGTLSGFLAATTTAAVLPVDAVGNSNVTVNRFDNKINGALIHVASTDEVILHKRAADGLTTQSELRFSAADVRLTGVGAVAAAPAADSLLHRARGDLRYLQLTGGTIAGNLFIKNPGADAWSHLIIDRGAGAGAGAISFRDNNGSTRWYFQHGVVADSNLTINRSDAAGAYQSTPFALMSNGRVTLRAGTDLYAKSAAEWTELRMIKTAVGMGSVINFCDANTNVRWGFGHAQNADSTCQLTRNDAAGVYQNTPFSVSAATGAVSFAVAIVNGPSDATLKDNIAPITGALDKVMALQGRSFNMLSTPDKPEIGLIAQEVELILPELIQHFDYQVSEHETEPKLAVDYSRLTAVLVEAIKELRGLIAAQAGRLNQLEAQVD